MSPYQQISDYQRIKEEFYSAALSATNETTGHLREKTAAYSNACQTVNQALTECDLLLQRGLRSEALQFCERDPNLLESLAALDIPDLGKLRRTLQTHGLVIPPPLKIDVGAELNDAYALEQLLDPLLTRHRLLALARSRLPLRIEGLRLLAESDPTNPVWNEDLSTFESERLKKLQEDGTRAANREDAPALLGILEEIENTPWIELPSESVVRRLKTLFESIEVKQIRSQLEQIVENLEAACTVGDVATARSLREPYFDYAKRSKLSGQAPVIQRAAPLLAWLREADQEEARSEQLQHLVGALRRGLDRKVHIEHLMQLHGRFREVGRAVPADLELEYKREIAKRKSAERQKLMLGYGIGISFLVLVFAVIGWMIAK